MSEQQFNNNRGYQSVEDPFAEDTGYRNQPYATRTSLRLLHNGLVSNAA